MSEKTLPPENPATRFWDWVEKFQGSHTDLSPNREAGVSGLKVMRKILEPHWVISNVTHPLANRFPVAYDPNYVWFSSFAKMLVECQRIPGSQDVISKLGIPEKYFSASFELDFALKVRLYKIPCQFVAQALDPTPDLRLEIGGSVCHAEVTSLNPSEQSDIELQAFHWLTVGMMPYHCVCGGALYSVRNLDDLEKVKVTVEGAIKEAVETRQLVRRNIPGLLTYYVVREEQSELMPAKWLGHFESGSSTPRPTKDKIVKKIGRKATNQLALGESSVLIVYDMFSSTEQIHELANNHDIVVKVETIPNLAAVVLIHKPLRSENLEPRVDSGWGTTIIEHSLPNSESESCVVWESSGDKHAEVINALRTCLVDFPARLRSMLEAEPVNLAQE